MKIRFKKIRKVRTLHDLLIALGDGLYVSISNPSTTGYAIKDGKVVYSANSMEMDIPIHKAFQFDQKSTREDVFAFVAEQVEWYEDIPPNGLLCWIGPPENRRLAIVRGLVDDQFYDHHGLLGSEATPLTKDDLKYLAEEYLA